MKAFSHIKVTNQPVSGLINQVNVNGYYGSLVKPLDSEAIKEYQDLMVNNQRFIDNSEDLTINHIRSVFNDSIADSTKFMMVSLLLRTKNKQKIWNQNTNISMKLVNSIDEISIDEEVKIENQESVDEITETKEPIVEVQDEPINTPVEDTNTPEQPTDIVSEVQDESINTEQTDVQESVKPAKKPAKK